MEPIDKILNEIHYTPINVYRIVRIFNFINLVKTVIPILLVSILFFISFDPIFFMFIPLIFAGLIFTNAPTFASIADKMFWTKDMFDMISLKKENNQLVLYTRTTLISHDMVLKKLIMNEIERLFKSKDYNTAIKAFDYYSNNYKELSFLGKNVVQFYDKLTVKRIEISKISEFMRNYLKINDLI